MSMDVCMNPKPEPTSTLLTVVVPVYNEAANLPAFLDELIPYCCTRNWNLILVDDGSKDESPALLDVYAGQPGVTVLHHKVNRGYGGALKTGLMAAVTPYAVTIDADGQHTLSDIDSLLTLTLEKDADLVVGSRGKNSSGLYRNIGKWLIRRFASLLMPIHLSDLNSGFKLYCTPLVQRYLPVCPDAMAFSDVITLVFIKKRHLVLEHPISIKKRAGGRSTINTFTAFQTIMEIINITMLFNPLRIFLPLSVLCISFGFGWGIPIMLRARGVSVGAMLSIVTG
ncbi:glycosyltransferase family 2 protein, partial [bacterium]|nr:glycosyltransferase family 2 protein [bacterium]